VTERDPGAQWTGCTPLSASQFDRRARVRVVAAESAGPFGLSLIGGRAKAGLGVGAWTLVSTLVGRSRPTRKRGNAPGGSSWAAVREKSNATLLACDLALARCLSLGLRLPIAHDPAPLAALVDHSHVLLTSKDNEKKRATIRRSDPIQPRWIAVATRGHFHGAACLHSRTGSGDRRRIMSEGPLRLISSSVKQRPSFCDLGGRGEFTEKEEIFTTRIEKKCSDLSGESLALLRTGSATRTTAAQPYAVAKVGERGNVGGRRLARSVRLTAVIGCVKRPNSSRGRTIGAFHAS
jgi:hypothetical protein